MFLSLIIIMTKGIYLLLGCNLGDKNANLKQAKTLIQARIGQIEGLSSVYETAAWGKTDQPTFLNQVIEVSTSLSAGSLLSATQQIEKDIGRVRIEKWGERIIDIDLLYYNDNIYSSEHLSIPHPGIPARRFTLVPLVELAPDFIHPVLEKTNRTLLAECQDTLPVNKILVN